MRKRPFSDFIHELHAKWKCSEEELSAEKICEGLCSPRTLQYLESGKQKADKLLQDCILERLGIGTEDYEHFLGKDAYDRWEARLHILHSITFEETEQSEQLLAKYAEDYDIEDKLERQFYLSMLAQVRRCQGASREELSALFSEAVSLTVPAWEQRDIGELVLSSKELNLILEAEQYRAEGARIKRYLEVIGYLGKGYRDGRSMAKIYPKAVYFLCRRVTEEIVAGKGNGWTEAELLRYCNKALDILRDNGRMYYLWEILDIRERLLAQMAAGLIGRGGQGRAGSLDSMRRENAEWKKALEEVYARYKLPKETFEYCYLYVEKGVFCTNDVIRNRREMLGMSREELCHGICSKKTLYRLERKATSPQSATAEALFERLGMSGELSRTELVTSNPEARALMTRLREKSNKGCWDEADKLREKIKNLVPMEIQSNRQVLIRKEILSLWKRGKLNKKEYCQRMKEALELTLPFEAFLKEGEKYLTHEEQSCIQNMMQRMDTDSEEFTICMRRFAELYQPYIDNGMQEAVSSMYELIMSCVSSELGNLGEFVQSDKYNEIIIRGCLRFRRLEMLHIGLYDRWWNYAERKRKGIPTDEILDDVEELTRCFTLSKLCKFERRAKFYHEKMETIKVRE